MTWNPFENERRILILVAVMFIWNAAFLTLATQLIQQFETFQCKNSPDDYARMRWLQSGWGLLFLFAFLSLLFLIYRIGATDRKHWLNRHSFFGVKGYLGFFAMAVGGFASILLHLFRKFVL